MPLMKNKAPSGAGNNGDPSMASSEASAAESEGGLSIHPMEQFEVTPLFGDGHGGLGLLTITNSTLWMALVLAAVSALLILGMRGRALVPTRVQSMAEILYGFVRQMVTDVLGEEGVRFFPYIFTLFVFILFSNLLGLVPYSFAVTSHIAITGVLAMVVFCTVVVLGFVKNGVGFIKMFWVDAAPLALRPVLAVIELISFFVRPLSHSIRLAGNIMAGHAVLKVFAAFVPVLSVFGILPLAMMVAMTGLEFLVAGVQAYIFAILTCIYLKDALHPAH
jgi:F-type H+-transporting ATPase subunit a